MSIINFRQLSLFRQFRKSVVQILLICTAFFWTLYSPVTAAATISTTYTNIGSNQWKASFLINAGSTPTIEELSIFFDYRLYNNLSFQTVPVSWNGLIAQPDAVLESDGFLDILATDALLSGQTLEGLVIRFDYFGTGAPGPLRFDLVDPDSFDLLESGFTASSSTEVPEPGTLNLIILGIFAVLSGRRIRSTRGKWELAS